MPSHNDVKRLQDDAAALDRIIRETQRVKAEAEYRLREIRQVGKPSPKIERRKRTRKARKH